MTDDVVNSRVVFFSEDRLALDSLGRFTTIESSLAEVGWARGYPEPARAVFAARVGRKSDGVEHELRGNVVALPYYQGALGLLLSIPTLALAIYRTVRHASVVCVRVPGAVGLIAVCSAAVLRKPIVAEIVGDIGEVLRSGVAGKRGTRLAGLAVAATRWSVRRASIVRYVTSEKLQKIYPSHPTARTFAFSDVVLAVEDFNAHEHGAGPAPRIIAVGSQEQMYKGHDLLIHAVSNLKHKNLDLELVLLGQGRYQEHLRKLAHELGVTDNVSFRGHVSSKASLRDELDKAWIFAMPSRTEGLPRALAEAMARNRPCVVSDVGGMPELVDRRWVVPSEDVSAIEDVIVTLVASEELRQAVGLRNGEVIGEMHLYWQAQRQLWVEVLRALLPVDSGDAR